MEPINQRPRFEVVGAGTLGLEVAGLGGDVPRPARVGIPVVAGIAALLLLGAVGFAFGYVLGGGRAGGGVNDGNQYQRAAAVPIVVSLNSQAELYKLQHRDTPVDFVRFPNWEQFTQFTDEWGNVSPVKGGAMRYGWYLQQAPVNPLNKLWTVAVVDAEPAHGETVPGGRVGFVYCTVKERFYVTDVSGTKVIDVMKLAAADRR